MADEANIAGGRLLGTQNAQRAVDDIEKSASKLAKAMDAAAKRLESVKDSRAGRAWSSTLHTMTDAPVGGNVTFGMKNVGLDLSMARPVYGQPGASQKANFGQMTALPNAGQSRLGTFMRGPGGAGSGGGVVGMGAAAAGWGNQYMGDMVGSNLIGVQAANYGANGGNWSAASHSRLTNQAYGQGLADRQQAQGTMLTNLGPRAFNGGYDASMRGGGYLNPTMSAQSMAGAQQTFGSARFFNQSLMYGVRTLNGQGRARDQWDVNADYSRLLGVNGGMTNKQLQASFAQNSRSMISLRSQGWNEDQIQMFRSQAMATSRIQQQGGSAAEAKRLFQAAGGVGGGARDAQGTLKDKYGFTTTDMQQIKGQQAAADDARSETLKGFSAGLNAASNAVEQFSNAIQGFLRANPGIAGGVGAAGGGGAIGAGALSSAAPIATALGGSALGSFGWNALKSKMGWGGKVAPAVGKMGSVAGRVGKFARFGGGLALAFQAGDELMHARSRWNHGWAGGQGEMSYGDLSLGEKLGSPITAAGAVAGYGSMLGGIATGKYDYVGPGGERGGPGGGAGISPDKVVAKAAQISASGKNYGLGRCQYFVRTTMGAPGGASTAAAAWAAAKYKHPGDTNPPPGASVFWTGGSTGAGHAAISAGGGKVYSTDVMRDGKVDLTTIDWINQHWKSEHYVGWAEDNNGVRVNVGSSTGLSSLAGADGTSPTDESASNARSAGAPAMAASIANYGSVNEAEAVAGALGASVAGTNASSGGSTSGSNNAGGSMGSVDSAPSALGGNQRLVQSMAAARGWKGKEWDALYALVNAESSFNNNAKNPKSTAFGMFQFLDSTWGGHKKTGDPRLQTQYGLDYIANRYDSPSKAWSFHQKNNWYDKGAWDITQDQGAVVHQGEMIIPARQADTIRSALQKDAGLGPTNGTSGVSITFGRGAVVIHVDGVMDDIAARKAAKKFADFLSEDTRIKKLGVGR